MPAKSNGIAADRSPVVLAFHAERLHDDRVWQRVRRIAGSMKRQGLCGTFFIYPFPAQVAGGTIGDRVQEIAALGHEIAQHTHFYATTAGEKPFDRDDLGEQNVLACMRRDFTNLSQMSCRPRGFTAGAWRVNETIHRALTELGFAYDCSSRLLTARALVSKPNCEWLRAPRLRQAGSGSLLCLPTTCSLGQWFKWAWKVRTDGPLPYQLVHVHDYDTLRPKGYVLVWLFLSLNARRWMALDDLTERLRHLDAPE